MSRLVLGVFCVLGVLATIVTPHLAEACPRWSSNGFDPCDQLITTAFQAECADLTIFKNRQKIATVTWAKTPEQACKNWGLYGKGGQEVEIIENVGPGIRRCAIKANHSDSVLVQEYDKSEQCCSRVPMGPHAGMNNLGEANNADVANNYSYDTGPGNYPFNQRLPVVRRTPSAGEEFTWYPQRYGRGVAVHHGQSGNVRRSRAVPGSPLDKYKVPIRSYSALRNHPTLSGLEDHGPNGCPDGVLDSSLPKKKPDGSIEPCRPQVDHIIPKKDVYGCNCGANSYANALLISLKLNQSMLNDCNNSDREAIMNAFSAPSFASHLDSSSQFFLALVAGDNGYGSSWVAAPNQDRTWYDAHDAAPTAPSWLPSRSERLVGFGYRPQQYALWQ